MTDDSDRRRRTFGPVVLVAGLAAGALAMAGTQPWFPVQAEDCNLPCPTPDDGIVSSANAVALVTLACLGVVLVTRGRFRRVMTVVGLLSASAGVATVVLGFVDAPEDVAATGWAWIGAVASVVGVLAWGAAVRCAASWPEMGTRYDTPRGDAPEDLWKALDHGHDPTA